MYRRAGVRGGEPSTGETEPELGREEMSVLDPRVAAAEGEEGGSGERVK